MTTPNPQLAAVNSRLRRDNCKARVVIRSNRLYVQATLPPSPRSDKAYSHQQQIALKMPATTQKFFSLAESQARKLSWELYEGRFEWGNWREPPKRSHAKMATDLVEAFKVDFDRMHPQSDDTLWKKDYWSKLKHLEGEVTRTSVLKVIERYEPHTRSRKRACMALNALIKFAELDIDISAYTGNYNRKQLNPRDIPSDRLIAATREQIKSDSWRWVFGMLAAYGLRPHEIMFCEFSRFPRLDVTESKTGSRIVYPILEEWATQWELHRIHRPNISGKTHSDLGMRVTQAFNRLGLPQAYNLRHGWCIRAIGRVPDAIAAEWQGHGLDVHNKRYHRWIKASVHQEAFNKMKEQS